MADDKLLELRKLLLAVENRMKPLEYDASRNQIHDYKRQELVKLQEEYAKISVQIQEVSAEKT